MTEAAGTTEKLQLKIGGMACSFCSATIARAAEQLDGVRRASVSLAHEEALIEYEPGKVSPGDLTKTLSDLGYTVRDPDKMRSFEDEEAELRRERNNLLLAGAFAVAAFVPMPLMWLGRLPSSDPIAALLAWWMPTLALSAMFGPGWRFMTMAWASLRRRILNQHVLMEFGAFAGLIGGFLGFILPEFPSMDFFAVAVFLTGYHILSSYVSLRVRTRSSQAVRKLLALVPPTARVPGDGPLGFQPDVFDHMPGTPGYQPLRRIRFVTWEDGASPRELRSAGALQNRETNGEIRIERTGVVVNMPIVEWAGGER